MNKTEEPFISIDYEEFSEKSDLGYEGVFYRDCESRTVEFSTGNVIKDWFDCMNLIVKNKYESFITSSTVDSFLMDGAKVDCAYLQKGKNGIKILKYGEEVDRKLGYIKFFVPENTKPTWAELKKLCK